MFKVNAYRLCFFSALFSINSTKEVYSAINSTDISQSEQIEQIENAFLPDIFQQTENNDSTAPLFPIGSVMPQPYNRDFNNSTHTFIPIGCDLNSSTDPLNVNGYFSPQDNLILIDEENTYMNTNNSTIPPAVLNQENNNVPSEQKSTESDTSPARQKAFNQRLIIHNPGEEKPWQCGICKKSFLTNTLTTHIKRHSNVKPFKCNFCPKSFTTKYEQTVHHRTHTKEKPYECDICKKRFSEKSNLKTHIRTHTGKKPYKCHICQKGLASKHSLKNHLNKHEKKTPFKCTQCNKTLSSKSALNSHIKKHNIPKPFVCQYCSAAFAHKKEYKDHIRYHEETDDDRKCHICKKVYADKRGLTKHNKRAHSEK